jgi:hypothetical protein
LQAAQVCKIGQAYGGNVMVWRLWREILAAIIFVTHGLHAFHDAPQTYDDPHFTNKIIIVAIGFAAIAIGHLIQREEDKLKSTQS